MPPARPPPPSHLVAARAQASKQIQLVVDHLGCGVVAREGARRTLLPHTGECVVQVGAVVACYVGRGRGGFGAQGERAEGDGSQTAEPASRPRRTRALRITAPCTPHAAPASPACAPTFAHHHQPVGAVLRVHQQARGGLAQGDWQGGQRCPRASGNGLQRHGKRAGRAWLEEQCSRALRLLLGQAGRCNRACRTGKRSCRPRAEAAAAVAVGLPALPALPPGCPALGEAPLAPCFLPGCQLQPIGGPANNGERPARNNLPAGSPPPAARCTAPASDGACCQRAREGCGRRLRSPRLLPCARCQARSEGKRRAERALRSRKACSSLVPPSAAVPAAPRPCEAGVCRAGSCPSQRPRPLPAGRRTGQPQIRGMDAQILGRWRPEGSRLAHQPPRARAPWSRRPVRHEQFMNKGELGGRGRPLALLPGVPSGQQGEREPHSALPRSGQVSPPLLVPPLHPPRAAHLLATKAAKGDASLQGAVGSVAASGSSAGNTTGGISAAGSEGGAGACAAPTATPRWKNTEG